MDHEWFTNQLDPDQRGWDWFSVQLENGTELMLFQLRRTDGTIDPFSSGTYIAPDGRASPPEAFGLHAAAARILDQPRRPARAIRCGGGFSVPVAGVELECAAVRSRSGTGFRGRSRLTYWEGAVRYSGSAPGVGYLEMTGYAKPVRL